MILEHFKGQVLGTGGKWDEAYRRLKEFCRRLGGRLVSLVDVGVAKPGEKLFSVSCIVPRRLENERLAEAIHEVVAGDVKRHLSEVIDELGDFEIEEESPSKRVTKYSMFSGTVTIHEDRERRFAMPASEVEYVYPDPVEDFLETREARISVRARGSSTVFKEKRDLRAYSWGSLTLYEPEKLRKDKIRQFLDELDEMVSDILRNPRNFFKFRGE